MQRDKIVKRIQALLSKTTENGATEAEALAAAEKAGQLMQEYNVRMTDVEVQEDNYTHQKYDTHPGKKRAHEVQKVAVAIGAFCDCKTWKSGAKIAFFGADHDVEIAMFLIDLCKNAMESEWRRYQRQDYSPGHGRVKRSAFMTGMARRLNGRLHEMKKSNRQETTQTSGRDLVPVKQQVVEQKFKEQLGLKLRKNTSKSEINDGRAFSAGISAGDNVNLTRGVRGPKPSGRLTQ